MFRKWWKNVIWFLSILPFLPLLCRLKSLPLSFSPIEGPAFLSFHFLNRIERKEIIIVMYCSCLLFASLSFNFSDSYFSWVLPMKKVTSSFFFTFFSLSRFFSTFSYPVSLSFPLSLLLKNVLERTISSWYFSHPVPLVTSLPLIAYLLPIYPIHSLFGHTN